MNFKMQQQHIGEKLTSSTSKGDGVVGNGESVLYSRSKNERGFGVGSNPRSASPFFRKDD
jgi:hypothetical protein